MDSLSPQIIAKIFAVIGSTALIFSFDSATPTLAADAPSRWIGQADETSNSFEWPGSGFELAFDGSTVSVTLEDSGKNSLVVDRDGEISRLDLEPGIKTYRFDAQNQTTAHNIKFFRRTEKMFGPTKFISAETNGTITPTKASKRQILAIGDSITAGYGIEGKDKSCKFSPDTENQYLTYSAVAARSFGADLTTLAISGIRLSPKSSSDQSTMPSVFDRLAKTKKLNQSGFDVVVINLGTNDFSGKDRPAAFGQDYARFVEDVRRRNPRAMIYAAIGPMLTDPQFNEASEAIKSGVQLRSQEGDERVAFLPMRVKASTFGCNWHPNAATHARVAEILAGAIERDLDWKPDVHE